LSSQPTQPCSGRIDDPAEVEAILREMWNGQVLDILGHPSRPLAQTLVGQGAPEGMDNPYWSIVRWLPQSSWSSFGSAMPSVEGWFQRDLPVNRDTLTFNYAFAIPSPGDIAFLTEYIAGRKVIEIGAGTGYWAWQLAQAGVDVLAYDTHDWVRYSRFVDTQFHPVHEGSVEQLAEHPDRMLMLCWPDYNTPFALDAVTAYTGDCLIYIGEGWGGCTGDEEFGRVLNDEWDLTVSSRFHINYGGINSYVGLYRRQSSALPSAVVAQMLETVEPLPRLGPAVGSANPDRDDSNGR
jgi:hypothetical protein